MNNKLPQKGDIIDAKTFNCLINMGYSLECYKLKNWRTMYEIISIKKQGKNQ